GLSVPHQKTRNDGVERSLGAPDAIGVPLLERETDPAVLHADPGPGYYDTGAEEFEVGLDQRHHHAVFVGGCDVNSAAMLGNAEIGIASSLYVDVAGSLG